MSRLRTWIAWSPISLAGVAAGLAFHALNPGLGLLVAVAGLIGLAVIAKQSRPATPWLVFLFAGLVLSSLIYFGLALYWQLYPTPPSNFGTGQATPVR